MTPSWYDLLGVEPDASSDQIRAAWKTGIAELDPSDRRFRVLNEAAEVLLDPVRRATYDASQVEAAPAVVPVPLEEVTSTSEAEAGTDPSPRWSRRLRSDRPETETPAGEAGTEPASSLTARRRVPGWVLAAVAVLTVLMVVAVAYLFTRPSDEEIGAGTSDAQSAAERAATTILSYDYRTMDEDQEAADALMTPSYRKDYDKLFTVLKENQPTTKTVVAVKEIVASGIVRSGDDRVEVLVFVNRTRTNAQDDQAAEYRDQVVMTMVHDSGDWLVDCMDTNQLAGAAPSDEQC